MPGGPSIRVATALGLTLCLPLAGAAQPVVADERPRIGLALGGGSARGLAHVGVLEWLEEHRIPIDVIAGTSIGGLVGGGYATGRSAADVRALIEAIDWDVMLRGEVAYPSKAFRRKEDRREFPVGLEFGVRDGLRLAPGLDPGHEIGLFLSRLALPYAAPLRFDDLPIPFRAVATDLEAAVPLALDRGSLAGALRATMAIPGIFEPIVLDDRFLADGGLLNNVPADVARAMGADIVIAVDVGEPLDRRERLTSLVAVANQAIAVMMAPRTLAVLDAHADHVIAPAVEDVRSDAWRDFEQIRQEGYDGAAAAGGALRDLSLSPDAWARHLEARQRRRVGASDDAVAFVRVEGVEAAAARDFEASLSKRAADAPLTWASLEERLTTVAGGGRYGSLGYDVVESDGETGAAVVVREKPHGPPFLNVAVALENEGEAVALRLGTRFTAYDLWVRDAEARVDVALGTDVGVEAEYLLRPAHSSWFIAPSVALRRATRPFSGGRDPLASYRVQRARVGLDLGLTLGTRSELRIGYRTGSLDAKGRRATTSPLPRLQGREDAARLRWVYDGHDNWIAPHRGTRVVSELSWLNAAPGQSAALRQAASQGSTFVPTGDSGRVFVAFRAATSFGDTVSPFYQFTQGGPFSLGAFDRDQFRGAHAGYLGAGYLREIGRLPDLLGGAIDVGAWLESGSAFEAWEDADIHSDLSAGLLIETVIGALLVSGSLGDDGSSAFYVALGRPFW